MLDFGDREIDRPLGQGAPGGRMRPGAGAGALAGLATFAVLTLLSVAAVLHDDGLRSPSPIAVAQQVEPAPAVEPERPVAQDSVPRIQDGSGIVIRDPATLSQSSVAAHLPDPDLVEPSDYGMLPIRSADGRTAFDAYARPWSGARGPRVAIVVGGLGLSQTGTQRAIELLPPEVTLGFAPAGNSLMRWMQDARRKGHELVMQVPMEPLDYPQVDPGRGTLTVAADAASFGEDLRWSLGRITNYTAVMNYMGAALMADPAAMQTVMGELADRGVGFLDDGSSARSVADREASAAGVPHAVADLTIDATRERGAIMARLDEAERIARMNGQAIVVASAFDTTVDAVAAWVSEARLRGIEIVGYSAVANRP